MRQLQYEKAIYEAQQLRYMKQQNLYIMLPFDPKNEHLKYLHPSQLLQIPPTHASFLPEITLKIFGLFHFHSYQFKLYMYSTIKRINQYTFNVSDKIGNGCSSQVYLGVHQKTRQRVAIKIIPKTEYSKAENIKIAQNQIQCLLKLKEIPHLLQILHSSQTKNNIYIITDICQGGTLLDLLKKKDRLNEEEALIILKQIIQAFGALATMRIIHRDLKPSNIFINKNEQVVIGDFGFAVQLEQNQETFLGNAGSPYYMAPQVLFDDVFSIKSDIWAIGVIYLQMLIGKIPWKSSKESELKIQLQELELSNYLPKNLSPQSREFLHRTLEKSAIQRLTVQELVSFSFQRCKNQEKKKLSVSQQNKDNSMSTDASNKSLNTQEGNYSSIIEKKEQSKSLVQNSSSSDIGGLVREQCKIQLQAEQAPSVTKIASVKDLKEKPSSKTLGVHKLIIQQITPQIYYFRFLYKIYKKINEFIQNNLPSINSFSQHLLYLAFNSINQTKDLNRVTGFTESQINDFKGSENYEQVLDVLNTYIQRYMGEQKKEQTVFRFKSDCYFLKLLKSVVQIFYQNLIASEKSLAELIRKKARIFLIEDLLKLNQLFLLSKNADWKEFAEKSNLLTIMQQKQPLSIDLEYWQKVKLKYTKMLNPSSPTKN